LITAAGTGPAAATFGGRNGRIAWSVFSAGAGGGGGFASLTTFSPRGTHRRVLGQCNEDASGNVCGNWQDVTFAPHGRHLLWDQPGSSTRRVIVLAAADASHPHRVAADAGADDLEASFARDGRHIVYVRIPAARGGTTGTLVIEDLRTRRVTALRGVTGSYPQFAPGGRRIMFIGPRGGVWSVGLDGRHEHRLIARATNFDIAPDGHRLAYVGATGDLYVARVDGSHARRVATEPDGSDPIEAVRFSPDGRLLVFGAQASSGALGETLYEIRAGGGIPSVISSTKDVRAVTTGLSWQPLRP
jgi:Tol biopolymer transport system component